MSDSVLQDRRKLDFSKGLAAATGWHHSMDFPDGEHVEGYIPICVLRERYRDLSLPEDLSGRTALDIGAWDGWFSFEMERHGADVTAVDLAGVENFLHAHRRFSSAVKYVVADVYDPPSCEIGRFDYVLFLGVLYHLRHPLLALETVCALTRDMAVVDSFVVDEGERSRVAAPAPFMEFHETDELGGNRDNWFGPTVPCLMALCRSAGFARVEYVNTWHRHARVRCYRTWGPVPSFPCDPAPVLQDALNARDYGVNFRSRKEQYVTVWFTCAGEVRREDLRLPEEMPLGSHEVTLRQAGQNSSAVAFELVL